MRNALFEHSKPSPQINKLNIIEDTLALQNFETQVVAHNHNLEDEFGLPLNLTSKESLGDQTTNPASQNDFSQLESDDEYRAPLFGFFKSQETLDGISSNSITSLDEVLERRTSKSSLPPKTPNPRNSTRKSRSTHTKQINQFEENDQVFFLLLSSSPPFPDTYFNT